jgi:hypothetical protein
MVLKAITVLALIITTRQENTKAGTAYVYTGGPSKGYLCGLVQQNGTAFDVFLPALWPVPQQKPGTAPQMLAVPWLHYANQRDAQDAIDAYCPNKDTPAAILS